MKLKLSLAVAGLAAILACGAAGAATAPSKPPPTPTAPAAPATTTPAAPATTMPMDKQAMSKECSAMADQKGLHGKERKKFRAECKKNGGKMQ
jgi:hypothetical protein